MNNKAYIIGAIALLLSAGTHGGEVRECIFKMMQTTDEQGNRLCSYLYQHLSDEDMWVFNNAMAPMAQREIIARIVNSKIGQGNQSAATEEEVSSDYDYTQDRALTASRSAAFQRIRAEILSQSSEGGICHEGKVLSEMYSERKALYVFILGGCGGGNLWEQYLVQVNLIKDKWIAGSSLMQVGGRGDFYADKISVVNGDIILEGKEFSKDDPMCCPSLAVSRKFTLVNNKVVGMNDAETKE